MAVEVFTSPSTLTNVKLTLAPGAAGTTTVTVKGDMEFQAAEVGRSYRLEIRLFGEDKVGDNLPAGAITYMERSKAGGRVKIVFELTP